MNHEAKVQEARQAILVFIEAVNTRNAEAARAAAGANLRMTFPGNTVMQSIDEFFAWVAGRTPQSSYTYDTIDIVDSGDGVIAYASGSVAGVTVSGVRFSGVRVIDKFVLQGGKIVEKEAWSDMADFMRRAAG